MILGYVVSIVLTAALTGFLAWYAWRQRDVPGARAYARLALAEHLLALLEILSVFSPSLALALFWFRLRYTAIALMAVAWMTFALEYSGRKDWLSRRFLIGLFVVPLLTQVLLWSNGLHGLWVRREAGFFRSGGVWIADTTTRVPGLGYLAHTFYGLLLILGGIALILMTAWRMRRGGRAQAFWLASAGLVAFIFALNSFINFLPKTAFNVLTPGIGLSVLLIALAILRFQFLKRAPEAAPAPDQIRLRAAERRALAFFLLIFLLLLSGLLTGGYLYYANYERNFRAQVDEQLAAIANLKVSGLQNWRTERLGDAEVLRRSLAFAALVQDYFHNPADTQAAARLQVWLDSLRTAYGYERVYLLDTHGNERLASPPIPEPVAEHLIADSAATLTSGQVTFLDFHRDTAEGPIRLAVLAPVYAEGDMSYPLGVVVLRIDPYRTLYPYLQQWPTPSETAETLLVRREGDTVLFLNELRFRQGAALTLRISLAETEILAVKAALGQRGTVEGRDYRGHEVVGHLSAVPDSPWLLVTRMDKAEVYAPLRERLWQTLVAVGALTLVCGAGLLAVWRQQQLHYYRGQTAVLEALRESEERLRESEETYRNLFHNAQVGLFRTRISDGKILESNERLARMFGYDSREAFIAEYATAQNYVDPGARERMLHELQETGTVQNFQARFYRRDGSIFWAEYSARIYPEKGWIEGVVEDITARKQAEEQLRAAHTELQRLLAEAERARRALLSLVEDQKRVEEALAAERSLLRTLIDHLPVAVYVKDAAARRTLSNPVDVSNIGAASETEVLGKTDFELFPRELAEAFYADDHYVLETGRPILNREERITRPDGTLGWQLTSKVALRDGSGRVIGLVGIGLDITERKQAEEELRRRSHELSLLYSASQILARSLDPEVIGQRLIAAMEQLIGYEYGAVLVVDETTQEIEPLALSDQGKGAEFVAQDKAYVRSKGLRVGQGIVGWVIQHGRPARVGDVSKDPRYFAMREKIRSELCVPLRVGEKVIGALNVETSQPDAYDEHDEQLLVALAGPAAVAIENARLYAQVQRYAAELEQRVRERTAQLEAANKELEAFAFSVSHDLRAPLRAIRGFSAALMDSSLDRLDAQGRHYLERIGQAADQMGQFIEALLALSRVTRREMIGQEVDLSTLAREIAADLYRNEPQRQVDFVVADGLRVWGDAHLLRIAMQNLLDNAWKFTAPRPAARIEVGMIDRDGERIYFVRDNGVGFDMSYADKLFAPFQRLHSASEFPGTGIGLATVQRIIARHGGRIWAEAAVGEGAAFYFTLPSYPQ